MSLARGSSIEPRNFAHLAVLLVGLGCSSSASPTDGGPGSGGAHPGGAGGGGSGRAGHGGSSAGGALGTSGRSGVGGEAKGCEIQECFVANTCLDECGGTIVYTGCCACEPPSVDEHTCSETD